MALNNENKILCREIISIEWLFECKSTEFIEVMEETLRECLLYCMKNR